MREHQLSYGQNSSGKIIRIEETIKRLELLHELIRTYRFLEAIRDNRESLTVLDLQIELDHIREVILRET